MFYLFLTHLLNYWLTNRFTPSEHSLKSIFEITFFRFMCHTPAVMSILVKSFLDSYFFKFYTTLPFFDINQFKKFLCSTSIRFTPENFKCLGTRDPSTATENYYFHGKFIFEALVKDLINSTWIVDAQQVLWESEIL